MVSSAIFGICRLSNEFGDLLDGLGDHAQGGQAGWLAWAPHERLDGLGWQIVGDGSGGRCDTTEQAYGWSS